MTLFTIETQVVATNRHQIEADSIEEALDMLPDTEDPVRYAVEGQMGWSEVPDA